MTNSTPLGPADDESQGISTTSLGAATRRGAKLSLVGQLVTQAGSVVATILLARLLTPAEFGIVALCQSLLGLATLLSLSGVNAALVTRKTDLRLAASSYFWVALTIGIAAVGLFALAAPPLSAALGQKEAAPYVVVLSLSFCLSTLALIPNALLQRSMRFGWLNVASILAALTYFVTEVVLAYLGAGAWSVVVGQVLGSAVALVLAAAGARWRPRAQFSRRVITSDLRVTGSLGVGQVLNYIQQNSDYWTISATFGGPALGSYYVAFVLPNLVRQRLAAVVRQVMLPAYAAADSGVEIARLWLRTVPLIVGLGLPLLTGIATTAGPIVNVFFGSQWTDAITPMRILTIAAGLDLLMTSVTTIAVVRRTMRPYLVVISVRALTTAVLAVSAAITLGTTEAVAWALVLSALVSAIVQERILSRKLGVGMSHLWVVLARYVSVCSVMALAIMAVSARLPPDTPAVVELITMTATGVATYVAAGLVVARQLLLNLLNDIRRLVAGR